MTLENWGTGVRDVLSNMALEVQELNPTFTAFHESSGERYSAPYQNIVDRRGDEISSNRVETYKKLFEVAGLLGVELGHLRSSYLADALTNEYAQLRAHCDAANHEVARIGLGLPLGASLGYADPGTLKLALEGRRPMEG